MKFPTLIALALCAPSALAQDNVNCDEIIGHWQGEQFDYQQNKQVDRYQIFGENGEYEAWTTLTDGSHPEFQYEHGQWDCGFDSLIITMQNGDQDQVIAPETQVFEIQALNATYLEIRPDIDACDEAEPCAIAPHSFNKILDSSDFHGC